MIVVVDSAGGARLDLPWYLTSEQVGGYIYRKFGVQETAEGTVYHEWHVEEDDTPLELRDTYVVPHTHDEESGEVEPSNIT